MQTTIIKMISYLLLTLLLILPFNASGEEVVLRLMVWEGYTPEEYVKEFEKEIEAKYGIKLKMETNYASGSDDFYNPVRDRKMVMGYPREVISSFDTLNNNAFKEKLRQLAINAGSCWIGWIKLKTLWE